MLGMDGHIQLADMGGAGDAIGDMSLRKVRSMTSPCEFNGPCYRLLVSSAFDSPPPCSASPCSLSGLAWVGNDDVKHATHFVS